MSDDELAVTRNKKIGFVFQNFNLLSRMSALQNVALPMTYAGVERKERMNKAQLALERVGLGDRIHHKPNELSGGQRQRVAIARSLVNEPTIILADEPTGNLDSENSQRIQELFFRLKQERGLTLVVVTHDAHFARRFPRSVRMADGSWVF